ncbi:MAG: RepB family plasmid replication initiator protein [Bacteroidaceae bacterium]|nr:RepB family plasmid replication initiator protein [Bacteroidaceae bacterium]
MAQQKSKKTKKEEALEKAIIRNIPTEGISYINSPLAFTLMRTDLSKNQVDITVELADLLQDKISTYLTEQKRVGSIAPYLFSEEEMGGQMTPMRIYFSALNIIPQYYKDVELAAKTLFDQTIYTPVTVDGQSSIKAVHLFSSLVTPSTPKDETKERSITRRKGFIEFTINPEAMSTLFSMQGGYSRYIKEVTRRCKRPTTSRIYTFITAYRKRGEWKVLYTELHSMLGYDEYVKGKWVPNKYKDYSDFKKRVLVPAEADLRELALQEQVDCYFSFEEIPFKGKRGGTPEYILFHIVTTPLGSQHDRQTDDAREIIELKSYLQGEFGMNKTDCQGLLTLMGEDGDVKALLDYARHLNQYIKDNEAKIKNVKLYALKSLRKWIADRVEEVEPIESVDPKKTAVQPERVEPEEPKTDPQLLKKWDKFLLLVQNFIIEEQFKVWIRPIVPLTFQDDVLIIQVPNSFFREYIEDKLIESMAPALRKIFGNKVILHYKYRD